jgi:Contractile injection system tube protein
MFLVEDNNQRISCMLNPESVVIRRTAGVRTRESLSGVIKTDKRSDNPLLFTGGGHTALDLNLVFDISIDGSSIVSEDVRDLTQPIWDLTENFQRNDGAYRPALCRFIWGKCWNIPGVITSVAQKLESFSPQGVPRRSWLRLRLIRMEEQTQSLIEDKLPLPFSHETQSDMSGLSLDMAASLESDFKMDYSDELEDIFESPITRVDLAAYRANGNPADWRSIAVRLNLINPLDWLESSFNEISEDAAEGSGQ